MIIGDTQEDTNQHFDFCVHKQGDWVAAGNMVNEMGLSNRVSPEILKKMTTDLIAGRGGFKLAGTAEKIVADLQSLAVAGIDGTLPTWPVFIDGMQRFKAGLYPLLVDAGLR